MTKCLKISCDKEATPGFEACSSLHGADIRMYRSEIKRAGETGDRNTLALYTVEEALTYLK